MPINAITARSSRRLRRWSSAVAVATLAVSALAACSSTSTAPSSSPGGLKSIVFINPAPSQPGWQIAAKCFTDAAKKAGATPKVVGSPGASTSTSEQLTFIEQAIADGADGIVAASFTGASSLESAFKAARDKGILVATVESGQATKAKNFDVGLDIVKFGKDDADQIASREGDHRIGLLLPGLTGTPKIFQDAFEAELAKKSGSTIIQVISDNGDVTKDADLVSSLLTAHPEITDIVSVNPGSNSGVATAIKEAGAVGKTFLLGNSIADPAPEALKDGVASAFYAQQICDVGTFAVENLLKASKGEKVPDTVPVGTKFITKDDLAGLDLAQWN